MRHAKLPAKYIEKCRQKHLRLRTHLHSQLHLGLLGELDLAIELDSDTSLLGALLKLLLDTLLLQLLATSYRSMFESMLAQLCVSMCLEPRRQRLPGRQPVGRGVGGRIVVRNRSTTTYRWAQTGHGIA